MDALVLAGGRCSPKMRAATGVDNRALVELVPGRTMLSFVVDALQTAEAIGRIFVVGDVPEHKDYTVVAPGDTLMDNLLLGLRAMEAKRHVLLVSADIPFVTGAAVDDFVLKAQDLKTDLCYPIIPMSAYRAQYSSLKRTTLRLREGEFTGGNVFLIFPDLITNNLTNVRKAYAARKSIFRLGSMLGWGLLFKILVSQTLMPKLLSITDLEAAVVSIFDPTGYDWPIDIRAMITEHASLGTDVDKPADVAAARKIFSEVCKDRYPFLDGRGSGG